MPYYDHFSVVEPTNQGLAWAKRVSKHDLDLIEGLLTPDLKTTPVLEVGPGRSTFARECYNRGYKYISIEPNAKLAIKLTKDGLNVLQQLAPPIALKSYSCSVAYASHIMEHMVNVTKAVSFLKELARVTVEGGLVCLRVPDYLNWGNEFWNGDYTHNFVTTERRIRQMYTDTGLEVLKVRYCSGVFTGCTAKMTSFVAKIIPHRLVGLLLKPFILPERVYKTKTTFLGSLLIIGRKL